MIDYPTIQQLASIHGTPLYLYSRRRIEGALEKVRQAFQGFKIIYSVKSNPFIHVLETLRQQGAGIDAASKNEVLSCARLGFPISDIYYSAPGKKAKDIQTSMNAASIIADSLRELTLINEAASERQTIIQTGIRLNIPQPALDNRYFEVMSGLESKFGIATDDVLANMAQIKKLKNLRINGLHVYYGSQLMDEDLIAANFTAVSQAALRVCESFPIEYINYGGGFGIPYEPGEQELDLHKIAKQVMACEATRTIGRKGIRQNIELGRYLVAQAGLYVSEAVDIKRAGNVNFLILDGGMNAFFRPKFTGQTNRVSVIKKEAGITSQEVESYRLAGNTCTSLDVFYQQVNLPVVKPGDLIIFENAGAYGYSMSLLNFISFDKPQQVMAEWER